MIDDRSQDACDMRTSDEKSPSKTRPSITNHQYAFSQQDRRTFLGQIALGLAMTQMQGFLSPALADESFSIDVPLPKDARLGKLVDLNGYFPFAVPESAEVWKHRAEELRRQLLVANGLWPMPPRPPVEATVHGKVDREQYTVERVYFQSSPGLYVTGSLFRPKNVTGKAPVVLSPHGHWNDGRFFDHGELLVRDEIKKGAEKFPIGGRHPLQARCVQLARMGCVVFHYDMLGYADSVPFSQALAHGFKSQRSSMSQPDHWGLFSAQAELRLLSVMGLQTFNSIRALDWISTLPDVDTSRIGVTGASGGGTQTFMLTAVDDRPTAAFPAVMVSTSMQGGCTCENASYLRVGTGNVEIAALTAPRPLGMSAADDWTKELEKKGLPELKKLYSLVGAPDNVEGKYFPFSHNFNAVSGAMMYEFFNKHFKLGLKSITEEDYVPLTRDELTVWNTDHPKPKMDEEAERTALLNLAKASDEQIASLTPKDAASSEKFREIVGGGWKVLLDRTPPNADAVKVDIVREGKIGDVSYRLGYLNNTMKSESIPTIHLGIKMPPERLVIWITPEGKKGLFAGSDIIAPVKKLLEAGIHVVGLDLLTQGNSLSPDRSPLRSRSTENGRDAACFVFGYNYPLFAQRVQDIVTGIVRAKAKLGPNGRVDVVGVNGAGPLAAAAVAFMRDSVSSLAISTNGFRFAQITDIQDPMLLPGALKYGDLPALIGLCAPVPVWLGGEGSNLPSVTAACYKAIGATDKIAASSVSREGEGSEIAAWLLKS